MKLTIEEIRDYTKCPMLYKLKHVDKIKSETSIDEWFSRTMVLSVYHICFGMIEKKRVSYESTLKKWENLWFTEENENKYGKEQVEKKTTEACSVISDTYKLLSSESFVPIAVSLPYEFMFISRFNIHVFGTVDLVRVVNDKTRGRELQIVYLNQSKEYPSKFSILNDIDITMASHVVRKNFEEVEDDIIIRSVFMKDDISTKRDEDDFNKVRKIVENVSNGIRNKIFFPITSMSDSIKCSNCKYISFCVNKKSLD